MTPLAETNVSHIWYAWDRTPSTDELPLVLVHGAGGSHLHWPAELRRLPDHPVLVLDLPGHGRSSGSGRDEIAGYATAVIALLEALDLRRAVLGGHSMGGAVAQWVALTQPERVAGLVLIGTGARLRVAPALLEQARDHPKEAISTIVEWSFGPDAPAEVTELGRQALGAVDPSVLYADLVACDRFDIRRRLGEIGAPALIVGATEDRMTPLRFAQYLADNLPRADLHVILGAGHMMALERPEEVARAVTGFMTALTDGGRMV